MKRRPLPLLLALGFLALLASPALAGEKIEGNGFRVELPPGFLEAETFEDAGRMRLRSRLGHLPIDGAPDVRAYAYGDPRHPSATITLSRIDLKQPVRNLKELGIEDMEALRDRLPVGFTFQTRQVDGRVGLEMRFSADILDRDHTARIVFVACGDYVVAVVLDTVDGDFPNAQPTWDQMIATMKIVPGMNRVLVVLLFAGAGLLLLLTLSRFSGRLRRPKLPTPARSLGSVREQGLSHEARPVDKGRTPSHGAASGSMRRPPRQSPPERKGLRNTRPDSPSRKD